MSSGEAEQGVKRSGGRASLSNGLLQQSTAYLLVFDNGAWKPFAVTDTSRIPIADLLDIMNETLGEMGIAVRAKPANSDDAAAWADSLSEWSNAYQLYQLGSYDELPDQQYNRFQASEYLESAIASVEVVGPDETESQVKQKPRRKYGSGFTHEPPPEGTRWKYPAVGTQQQIAAAIGTDVVTMKKYDKKIWYYIQCENSRRYVVWVDSQAKLDEIKSKLFDEW